jgi:hypothetical protein
MMEKMLEIPKDLKRVNAFKICVLLGLTAILYMMILAGFSDAVDIVTAQRATQ